MPQKSACFQSFDGMVVALGALDLLAEEEPGRDRGQRHGAELQVGQRRS